MQVGESADITVPLSLHGRFQPDRAANRAQPWYWWIRVMGRLAPSATRAQVAAALQPTLQETAVEGWREGQSVVLAADARPMPEPPTLVADRAARERTIRGAATGGRCARSWASSGSCSSPLAPTSPTCCSPGAWPGGGRSRCASPSGRAGPASSASSWPKAWCSPPWARRRATLLAYQGRGLLVALRQCQRPDGGAQPSDGRRRARVHGGCRPGPRLVFGLAPALRATRTDPAAEFQGGMGPLGGARSRLGAGADGDPDRALARAARGHRPLRSHAAQPGGRRPGLQSPPARVVPHRTRALPAMSGRGSPALQARDPGAAGQPSRACARPRFRTLRSSPVDGARGDCPCAGDPAPAAQTSTATGSPPTSSRPWRCRSSSAAASRIGMPWERPGRGRQPEASRGSSSADAIPVGRQLRRSGATPTGPPSRPRSSASSVTPSTPRCGRTHPRPCTCPRPSSSTAPPTTTCGWPGTPPRCSRRSVRRYATSIPRSP